MKRLYSFYWDCGRSRAVEGLFIEEETVVNEAIGKEVYFGEILGKHSEVYGILEESDLKVLDVLDTTVQDILKTIGSNISGYNPLHYIED